MKLTKLEVSHCMEAVIMCRDNLKEKLDEGKCVHPDLAQELIDADNALIKKLEAMWKEMPVERWDV